MTTPILDALLKAHLDRLTEVGPTWTEPERDQWCALFAATVAMIYPARKRRKSRAKAAQ